MATPLPIWIVCESHLQAGYRVEFYSPEAVATHDFDDAICFELGDKYRIQYRKPTDPEARGIELGISLVDSEGRHRGWVKEESREELDKLLVAGHTNLVATVAKIGRRWTKMDEKLGKERRFRVGQAIVD